MTDVPPPSSLAMMTAPPLEDILAYLDMQDFLELPLTLNAADWAEGESIVRRNESRSLVVYPRKVNRLIELPDQFTVLLNDVSGAAGACPNVTPDETRQPTICLVCGKKLCSQVCVVF